MDLARDLREQTRSYVEGRTSQATLREWLEDRVQMIADADDSELRDLDGQLWTLISEHDLGHRDEVELRSLLAQVISAPAPGRA
jgi:hypothetical protein